MGEHDGRPQVVPVALGFVKVFIVRGERTILVDTGVAGSAPRIVGAIRRLGLEPAELSLIVLTHAHADHVGSAREIASLAGCPVMIHRGDAAALASGEYPVGAPVGTTMRAVFRLARPRRRHRAAAPDQAPGAHPPLVIDTVVSLRPWGVDGTVEPTPGHTPGSVSIFLAGGEVIVGDLLRGSLARAGKPRWPFVAVDLAENRLSAQRVLERRPTLIWTSHGGPLAAEGCGRLVSGPPAD